MPVVAQLAIAIAAIFAATWLISRLRHAEARLRTYRLEVLERKSALRASDLNRVLLSENARLIAKGIDQGALFMQGSHKVISEVTFGLMQLIPATRQHAESIRDTQNLITHGLIGAFRHVSEQVGSNIADKLKKPPATTEPKKKKTSKLRDRVRRRKKKQ